MGDSKESEPEDLIEPLPGNFLLFSSTNKLNSQFVHYLRDVYQIVNNLRCIISFIQLQSQSPEVMKVTNRNHQNLSNTLKNKSSCNHPNAAQ